LDIVILIDQRDLKKGDRCRIERVSSSGEYVLKNGARVPKAAKDKVWRFSERSLEEAAARDSQKRVTAAMAVGVEALRTGAAGMMGHMDLLQHLSYQAAAAQAAMPQAAMVYGPTAFGAGGNISAGPQVEARSKPWVKYRDGDYVYYYNEETRASTWDPPACMLPSAKDI